MLDLGQAERLQNLYRVYDKATNTYVQFKLKPAQRNFIEEAKGRDLILKSRQIGFTTLAVALGYDEAIWLNGRCGIMAHKQDTVKKIFEMARRMNEFFMKEYGQYYPLEEESNNTSRLSWKNIRGSIDVAYDFQGYTLTRLHAAEAAFIDPDRLTNSMQAVPENGFIVLESTPDGPGGYFYNVYQDWKRRRGSAPFKGHFYPWFENYPEHPENWRSEGRDLKLDAQEQELVQLYGLKDYHILYRRYKLAELGNDPDRFENQYPSDDVSCFLSGENNVYPTSLLKQQANYVCEPAFVGNLIMDGKQVRFVSDAKNGLLKIWDLPKPGKLYYGGADPSGGTGGDPGAAVLIDVQSGEQVAQLKGFMDPDVFADELFKLGQYYNQAFWCIEVNNHGHAVILKLKGVYPNLYRRQQFDRLANKYSQVIGFYTSNSEKVAITDLHVAACREGKFKVRSNELLSEMGTFVQLSSEGGRSLRREARVGCHDDLVIAACLCWEMVRARPIPDFTNEQYDIMATKGLSIDPDSGFYVPNESYTEDNWF